MIYLDNSATTQIFPCVADEICTLSKDSFYNISSSYYKALETEKLFLSAKKTLASFLGCLDKEIIFTSGGTESNNTALACAQPNSEVIVSSVEHHAILNCERTLRDKNVKFILCPVDESGKVNPDVLASLITEKTSLVSIMHVNNETGAVNDISLLAKTVKTINKNILFHSDGVQAFMHVCTNMKELGVDMYSVSAHKVHGPKGVGALFVKSGTPFKAFIQGGGQQNDMRSGTVNVPGYVGFARALEKLKSADEFSSHLKQIKQEYVKQLSQLDDVKFTLADSAPNILSVCIKGVRASTLQNALEEHVLIGKGSACTSRNSKISHVLSSMNIPLAQAEATVRLSFGAFNTIDEVDFACQKIIEAATHLRRFKRK